MAWLEPVTLEGEHAALEPLVAGHEAELSAACADGRLWELWYTTVPRPEAMGAEIARRLALLYAFNTAELPEKATFSAFITNLIETEFLCEDENGLLHFDERLMTPLADAELVLSVEARQAIRRTAGAGVAR